MRWQYSEWDQTLQDLLKSFQDLMSLFNYLMLMAGGDVDKVFKWMEYLQERGSLDPDVDLAEFRRQLEEQRIIEKLKEGSYALTAKGEQVIRRDSLNQIFNGLQKSGFGQHRVASTGNGDERLTETRPWRFGDPVTQIDALGMEFVLEGLHQHSMVSKREEGLKTAYRDMLKAMFDHMAGSGDD